MIFRFFQLALRYIFRFKTYSFINIGGLALGLASSIAILHFVEEEFSYDDFHYLPHNVYRLNTVSQRPTGVQVHAAGTPRLAPTLMADMPEVEAAVRLRHADDVLIKVEEKQFYENKVFYADSNFFKVMSFTLAKGNPETALTELNSAVITSEFADKYFGTEDPMNKLIGIDNIVVKVSGVTAPPPGKSHFKFDMLVSFETFTVPQGYPVTLTSWGWQSFPTYVRLREGSSAAFVESKFPAFITKYMNAEAAKRINYQLQPIQDVYLHSRTILERDGISTKGDYSYTTSMAAIAALILGIACFNFANLSAAFSTYRVKETGVKRTLGSGRGSIFVQFISESMLIAGFSLVAALILLMAGIKPLEGLLGASLNITWISQIKWLPFYAVLVLFIGCCGGLYPAFFLSRLKPQVALKGKNVLSLGSEKLPVRKAIIVFQFFITAALIATSITIKKQMDFLLSKDLGFDKESVIAMRVPGAELPKVYPSVKNKLTHNRYVSEVSAGGNLFDGLQGNTSIVEVGNTEESFRINLFGCLPNFIETMGFEMKEGRTFSELNNDSTSVILNESAVKQFGWEKDVIGRKVFCMNMQGEVIGVVKDFHFSSLHSAIGPLIIQIPRAQLELIFARVTPGKVNEIVSSLQSDWQEIAPHLPFDYILLDEHINQLYSQDRRFSQLAYVFCGLSVVLACLGLYGIISFMAEARTKEIGIRKVLGASVLRITTLLSGQFMIWVLVAAVIALPASYYLLTNWLSEFAYKIDVSVGILILSVLLSSLLAAATVSFKAMKAARANPVDSLRTE